MGRLADFSDHEIVKCLKQFGFEFHHQAAGSHEIWLNPTTKRYTTLPNHPAICQKARYTPFSSRQMSIRKVLAEKIAIRL